MANSEMHTSWFGVLIIESPSAKDFYNDRQEGIALCSTLKLCCINSLYKTVINLDSFIDALTYGIDEYKNKYGDNYFFLHISGHGDEIGSYLTDKTCIAWDKLRVFFLHVNKKLSGNLVVCMSACHGYAACRSAMEIDPNAETPYHALIGSNTNIPWSDAVIAFSTFYHLASKLTPIENAVEAMNLSAGISNTEHLFYISYGKSAHEYYIDYMSNQNGNIELPQPMAVSTSTELTDIANEVKNSQLPSATNT